MKIIKLLVASLVLIPALAFAGQGESVCMTNTLYSSQNVDEMVRFQPVALPQCVDHNKPCTRSGTKCCKSTDSCSGTFPDTYCQ